MKPYRTKREALVLVEGFGDYRGYEEVLGLVPSDEVRVLIDLRLDKKYKQFKYRNEMDVVRHIDWVMTPEGGEYWAGVVGWMVGLNDKPELAKVLGSDK